MTASADIFLAKMRLHGGLSAAESKALAGIVTRPQSAGSGAVVAAVGDPLDTATVVLGGMLARTKHLPDGRRQILSLLLPGDVVDPHASVLHNRDDELEAICASSFVVMPQSRIKAVEAEFPRLRETFLREAFVEAAIVREWVLNVGRRTAAEALAHLVCELCCRLDAVGLAHGETYPFALTQQDLADCLGLSVIHVNRVIRQLRASGVIKLERRWLSVLKRPALERLGNFTPDYLHVPVRDQALAGGAG